MGQVSSYIWRRIRRPNNVSETETLQNDLLTPLEEQSHCITIPDGDAAQPDFVTEEEDEEVIQFTPLEQRSHYIANPGSDAFQPEVVTEIISIVVDLKNDSVEHEEEKENEEVPEKEIQEVLKEEVIGQVLDKGYGVSSEETVGKIGPYTSIQGILLVGEGDFSFSTSLAVAFGCASNMIATSLNTQGYLTKNYRKFPTHKRKLETRGCMLIHEVDATTMVRHSVLGKFLFDIIIYNFPHIGSFGRDSAHLRKNQNLVRGFIRCAKKMITEEGEIHITHKTTSFYRLWDIPQLGRDEGLHVIQETEFILSMFPGYHTKYGYRGDKDFHCDPSKTYKFGLRPKSI